jgi:tripartite-type tricarboxylate transporter receptor subunit TctC
MNIGQSGFHALTIRAWVTAVAAVVFGCTFAWPVLGQTYPVKPVRLIVPFSAGGPTDIVARIFSNKFSEAWGQQVIVDNRAGANTIVGAEIVARAPPDGYTLLLTTAATHVNNTLLYRKLPYDAHKSFAPISMTVIFPYVLAVHTSVPANSVKAFVVFARARPGEMTYGSSGTGSSGHLAGVLFDAMTGTKMIHVPYKGAAPAIADTIAGQIPVMFTSMASAGAYHSQRKLKVLGVAASQRHPGWPDIPAIAEAGYPGFEMNTWYGFAATAGTPRAAIDRIHADTVRISTLPDVVERLKALGVDVLTNTPEEFAAYITRDLNRIAKVVKAANIRLD